MRKVLFSCYFGLAVILGNACTFEPETVKEKEKKSSNIQNLNANFTSFENGSVMPSPVANVENVNVASNSPLIQKKNRKPEVENPNEKPKMTMIPGAHNSSVGSMMNENNDFITIRIFNSHPVLSKLEQNEVSKKVKIFLKNGKTTEVPVDGKINFIEAAPQDILIAIGLAKPSPVADSSQTGVK